MLMGLADLALYAAIVGGTGNRDAVTASLSINFLRKTPPGGVLAHANILKTGRMAAGEVLLVPEAGGSPVAKAISTWALPRAACVRTATPSRLTDTPPIERPEYATLPNENTT